MNRRQQSLLAVFFFLGVPFVTFLLIWFRGLPGFAEGRLAYVLIWVYSVTWVPAAWAAALMSVIISRLTHRTDYFHKPYDFGRCFSLGAISGALTEALATWSYRTVTHHPFSDFWIAGAMIAGCLTGAVLVSLLLFGKK